jgi:uncharacterized protein YfaS (alpha-2-macroglobulin family)
MRQALRLLLLLALTLAARAALADAFRLPGLDADSARYERSLTARNPAGGTPKARAAEEQAARAAVAKADWSAAATAWEARIALGEATPDQYLGLAQAQQRRSPADPVHALQAAWLAYRTLPEGPGQIPALLSMAASLRDLDRPAQAVSALEAVTERAPADVRYQKALADMRQAAGLLVRKVRTEPETDPARACLAFTGPPSRNADFHPADWVRLDPPVADAAITREGDEICISGLPLAATTRVTLRGGMPGESGLVLRRDTTLAVAMASRHPRLLFDARLFVLPRGQAPRVTLTTVNVGSVTLKLARISERAMGPYLRDNALGSTDPVSGSAITDDVGNVIWSGRADIPRWQPNRATRTALPLPGVPAGAGPGLYALIASPNDGAADPDMQAVQMILRTDLAPTVWRGRDGLTVQVRGYGDARVRPGVGLSLIARNNDVLATATTGADGFARFPAPLLGGEGPMAPVAIHAAAPDGDFTRLDLQRAAFDLSDRGVAGPPPPGPLDAFVWLDRGIYRPGETVQVMALLRDGAGAETDIPARVRIRRPNGQVFQETVPARAAGASLHAPVALSPSAPAGTWTVEVLADPAAPPIGQASFRVDAFVPDRMAVDLGPAQGPIVPGTPYAVPLAARFLYGAPGSGLSGKARLQLAVAAGDPFPALAGYRVGLADEIFAPDAQDLDLPETDAQGHATILVPLRQAPDSTHPVQATVSAEVNDPSGHAARASVTVPVRPNGRLIGVRPLFADDAIDADAEGAFDLAAIDPDGNRVAVQAKLRIVRERPDWRLVTHGSLARYETVFRDEPLVTEDVTIPANGTLHFSRRFGFGRYRIEVMENGGLAATSMRFRAGWVSADGPDVPDKVDVLADRKLYAPGDTARIHIAAPFAGPATLLVLSDRVHATQTFDVPAGGAEATVKVDPAWGAGAYVAVHVFRPAAGDSQPGRAIGLAWVGIDPASRRVETSIEAPERTKPRRRTEVAVHAAPGAWVSLAAVDEGILRLTGFTTPDPVAHFLGRRGLGIDIRDDWGRLIAPADGDVAALRQGGDEGGAALPEIPQKTVTLFAGPVQADARGVARIPLDLPDFNGQVRLMAVAWQGSRVGEAATDMIVRDALVAEPLLPRFLAPGDQARLAVLLQNTDLPGGEAAAEIAVDGPLALDGPARLSARLAQGGRTTAFTGLRATGVGRGVIRLHVTGPAGFAIDRETAILVRPARGPVTEVLAGDLGPAAAAALALPADRFIAGTWRATASFGGAVRYSVSGLVDALAEYPLNCLEQAISRGLPLALLPDGPLAGGDRAGRLQRAVEQVLDKQRFDGGFGLWSASDEAEPWLSAYATEFLLRARAAGAAVPEQPLRDALKFTADATGQEANDPKALAVRAYDLHVLALAGQPRAGAERVLAERLDDLPTPLARAQLGAALARSGDAGRAGAAFAAALATPARKFWADDYGTALRDQVATALLLKESGVLPEGLGRLAAILPGADLDPRGLNTQEMAWAAAAGAVLGQGAPPARIELGGTPLPPGPIITVALTAPATARNLGPAPVPQVVSITGVPATAPPAARNLMRVTRRFLNLDGSMLDLDHLRQNTVFVLLLEGRADDGQDHRAQLLQGLPAGWEVAGRLGPGDVQGMSWLGRLSETEREPAADDRYAAIMALPAADPSFRLAVRLRAVTPGTYEIPGAELADMYRPALFARQGANRITVLPAE